MSKSIKYNGERISVEEAAEMLSMSKAKIYKLMQVGKLPIGIVDESETENGFNGYYIYKGRVEAFLKGFDIAFISNLKNILHNVSAENDSKIENLN